MSGEVKKDFRETAFDYIVGDTNGTFSTSEQKWINRIKRYAEQYPDEVQILHINDDGSIVAHAPVTWFKFSPKKKVSDKQREAARLRMQEMHRSGKI